MVSRLTNHAGCWQNTRRISKLQATGKQFTNSSRALPTSCVVYQPLVNSQLRLLHFQLFDWLKNSDHERIVRVIWLFYHFISISHGIILLSKPQNLVVYCLIIFPHMNLHCKLFRSNTRNMNMAYWSNLLASWSWSFLSFTVMHCN